MPVFTASPVLVVSFIKDMTSLSLVVQWNALIFGTTYVLSWYDTTQEPGATQGLITTRMTSYRIPGLTVNATYTITVEAHGRCGGADFKANILFSPHTTSTITIINLTAVTTSKFFKTSMHSIIY